MSEDPTVVEHKLECLRTAQRVSAADSRSPQDVLVLAKTFYEWVAEEVKAPPAQP